MATVQVAGPSFALQSAQELRVLIDEAAARLNVAGLIVEKDFWVGWLLGRLFAMPALAGQLQFKGGTSLSMVFGAVRRFSEDINMAILPAALGFEEGYFNDAPSASQRRKRMDALAQASIVYVHVCGHCWRPRLPLYWALALVEKAGSAMNRYSPVES